MGREDPWVERIRKDIPILSKMIHFDSASCCPSPRPVLEAMTEFARDYPFNLGGSLFEGSRQAGARADSARRAIAEFVGATSASEVVFTKNTTEALNILPAGLDWHPGDEVVLTNVDHQSNILPWQRAARRFGIVLRIVAARQDGLVNPEDVEAVLGPATKLVTITHVSNLLGSIQPVREIGERVKRRDILFMVDYAQSAGRMPVNVLDDHCDFACFCGRKALMGPQGSGFFWGREQLLEQVEPLIIGSRGANVTGDGYDYTPIPFRFEGGITNTSALIGLGTSVRYLRELGLERIFGQIQRVTKHMIEGLQKIDGVRIVGTTDPAVQAGIVTFNVRDLDPHDVGSTLDKSARVATAVGTLGSPLAAEALGITGLVRASVHCYNTIKEVDTFLQAVEEIAGGVENTEGERSRSTWAMVMGEEAMRLCSTTTWKPMFSL